MGSDNKNACKHFNDCIKTEKGVKRANKYIWIALSILAIAFFEPLIADYAKSYFDNSDYINVIYARNFIVIASFILLFSFIIDLFLLSSKIHKVKEALFGNGDDVNGVIEKLSIEYQQSIAMAKAELKGTEEKAKSESYSTIEALPKSQDN